MTSMLLTDSSVSPWGASVPVVFSYADQPWMIFGKTVFDFLDYLANNILLPVGASLLALFSAYVVGYARLAAHIDQGAGRLKIGNKWKLILKVIIPLALLIILWNGSMTAWATAY